MKLQKNSEQKTNSKTTGLSKQPPTEQRTEDSPGWLPLRTAAGRDEVGGSLFTVTPSVFFVLLVFMQYLDAFLFELEIKRSATSHIYNQAYTCEAWMREKNITVPLQNYYLHKQIISVNVRICTFPNVHNQPRPLWFSLSLALIQ